MKLKEWAKQLKTAVPTIYLCMKDKRTPAAAKLFGALTVGYALSPIDLIPDFIPILGYLDDLIILPALAALTLKFIPEEIYKENRTAAENMWQDGKPKKWYYALPIVIFWLIIAIVIIKSVFFN